MAMPLDPDETDGLHHAGQEAVDAVAEMLYAKAARAGRPGALERVYRMLLRREQAAAARAGRPLWHVPKPPGVSHGQNPGTRDNMP